MRRSLNLNVCQLVRVAIFVERPKHLVRKRDLKLGIFGFRRCIQQEDVADEVLEHAAAAADDILVRKILEVGACQPCCAIRSRSERRC